MAIYRDWASAKQGGPHAKAVARYHDLVQVLADRAKAAGGVTDADMALLEQEIEPQGFQRLGNFLEVQDFAQYRAMMKAWVLGSKAYHTEFVRMTEEASLVFLEIREVHETGAINSMSVYEFNPAGKISRLLIYLQMPRQG